MERVIEGIEALPGHFLLGRVSLCTMGNDLSAGTVEHKKVKGERGKRHPPNNHLKHFPASTTHTHHVSSGPPHSVHVQRRHERMVCRPHSHSTRNCNDYSPYDIAGRPPSSLRSSASSTSRSTSTCTRASRRSPSTPSTTPTGVSRRSSTTGTTTSSSGESSAS